MAFSFDAEPLEITCPNCGKKVKETVAWFKRHGQVCPHGCGCSFETAEFRRGVEDAEKAVRDFLRDMGRL